MKYIPIEELPKPVAHYTPFYGTLGAVARRLIVIHYAVSDPGNALPLARYCHTNPKGLRWHSSVGSDGSRYRCGHWYEIGAHDAGINTRSVGIECTARSGSEMRHYPKLMNAMAAEVVAICDFWKRVPSRDFIIGHYEDEKFGGTSTHQDPMPGWDWAEFMELVELHYAASVPLKGGDDSWLVLMT